MRRVTVGSSRSRASVWARRALISAVLAAAATTASAQSFPIQVIGEAGGAYRLPIISYRDMPFRTVVRQQYDFSCGSAALATLLRYQYGKAVSEADVFKAMWATGDKPAIQAHGFSLADMKRYLAEQGLKSDGYKMPLERYAKAETPGIAVVKFGRYKHFVVIKSILAGHVLVGDPALGLHSYTIDDFQKIWDGVIFVIHDNSESADHHGFDDKTEWALLQRSPMDSALHRPQALSDAALEDIVTVFGVSPPDVANTY